MFSQLALKNRTPTQINAALATKKPLKGNQSTPIEPQSNVRGNANIPGGQGAGSKEGERGDRTTPHLDPYAANYDLKGVGRSALVKLSTEKLMAAAIARNIKGVDALDKPRLVSRLEMWKRDRSSHTRGGGAPPNEKGNGNNDSSESEEEDNKPNVRGKGPREQPQPPPDPALGKQPEIIRLDNEECTAVRHQNEAKLQYMEKKLQEQQQVSAAQYATILEMQSALRDAKMMTEQLSQQIQNDQRHRTWTPQEQLQRPYVLRTPPRSSRSASLHSLPAGV